MPSNPFFAQLSRLKLIQRWPLMRSISPENVAEHSLQVAFIAHALAIIKNKKFDGQINAEKVALLAMYHDASEVLTGDLPTPVKYFNPAIASEYKKIEKAAEQKLLSSLPEEFQDDFAPFLISDNEESNVEDNEEYRIVKQADSLCAYLKCIEELSAGNNEFELARQRLAATLQTKSTPEMEYFLDTFAEAFGLTLDQLAT